MKYVDDKYNEYQSQINKSKHNNFYLLLLRFHILNMLLDYHQLDNTKKIPQKYLPKLPQKYLPKLPPREMRDIEKFVDALIKSIERHTVALQNVQIIKRKEIYSICKKIIAEMVI